MQPRTASSTEITFLSTAELAGLLKSARSRPWTALGIAVEIGDFSRFAACWRGDGQALAATASSRRGAPYSCCV